MTDRVAFQTAAPVQFAKGGPLGLYFAWGAFSKVDGADFVDAHGDVIPEDDLVAAAVTLASAGAVKVEHSGGARGEVPLVMPLTTDIAKALGIETRNSGLVVGIRPDAELAKAIDAGEIAELSIAGRAIAELAKAAIAKSDDEPVAKAEHKRTLRQLEIDEISLVKRAAHGAGTRIAIAKRADAAPVAKAAMKCAACGAAMTGDMSACPACGSTKKPVAKRAPALTDATDGHQHLIDDAENPDGFTSYERQPGAEYGHSHPWVRAADGSITVGETDGHTHAISTGDATMADDITKSLQADLAKARAAVGAVLALPAEQHAYAKRLDEAGVIAYLAKSAPERAELAKPVYVAKSGEAFYAADDARLVSMAKAHDAMLVEVEKAKGDAATVEIAKTAEALPAVKGAALLAKAVHALPAEERKAALADLATVNASLATLTKAIGSGAQPAAGGALEAFDAGLATFAKAAGKAPDLVVDDFLDTPDGARLYDAYAAEKAARR